LRHRVVDLPVQVRIARQLLGERALDAVELAADLGLEVALAHLEDHLPIAGDDLRSHAAAPAGADAQRAAEEAADLLERPVHGMWREVEEDLADHPQRQKRRGGVGRPDQQPIHTALLFAFFGKPTGRTPSSTLRAGSARAAAARTSPAAAAGPRRRGSAASSTAASPRRARRRGATDRRDPARPRCAPAATRAPAGAATPRGTAGA